MNSPSLVVALAAATALVSLPAFAGGPSTPTIEAEPASAANPAAQDWTGFWVGAAVGMGFSTYDIKGAVTPQTVPGQGFAIDMPDFGGNGSTVALQLGYNRQMSSGLVWGLELDHRSTAIESQASFDLATNQGSVGAAVDYKPKSLTTLSGRLGWQPTPGTLLYGLAGATRARFEGTTSAYLNGDDVSGSFGLSIPGLTVGLGMETMLGEHLSLKVDYRRTYLGDYSLVDTSFGDLDLNADLESNLDSFNVGLAYRF